ncbi:serine/threonine protein kinase [Streptomyces sp. BK208]|uniref:serine/threonine-protein kinase n=1 Tax=Streptomyces sp. BK208 TaxID=2512150 RepID=UPI00105C07A7|nr:serine/threonine-protein kinase [Streptomyces sp. BK208]TDT40044.1 serine/threonine protein kinase [Streptomyces sp. BK208]
MEPLRSDDPTHIGGYALRGRIGSGGMGRVYLGESPAGQLVGVKVIKASVLDAETRSRFVLEVENLKKVFGPRVAAFAGADPLAERPWLAVDYVPGPDLLRHVQDHGPLPLVETASLGALLAEGLTSVHLAELLHRDLKPQNILLGPDGPKVIDFGLAVLAERRTTLTATGVVVGSVLCMPPEQAEGNHHLTAAADVYALGAVLLFAATGHYPYDGTNWLAVASRIGDPDQAPDLTGLPGHLLPMVSAMLAHDPVDRPSLIEVTGGLVTVLTDSGLTARQARQRLIERTAPHVDGRPVLPPGPIAEYEPTLVEPSPEPAEGLPIPSVSPPGPVPVLPGSAEVRTVTLAPPPVPAAPRRRSTGGRTPDAATAHAIAEDLRTAYARNAAFVPACSGAR